MDTRDLKQLLSVMSLREKIGQMIQLTGIYFDEEAVLTGTVGEQEPPEWVVRYAGSVLGMDGAERLALSRKNIWRSIRIIYRCFSWRISYMDTGRSHRFRLDRHVPSIRIWYTRQQSMRLRRHPPRGSKRPSPP